MAKKPLTKESTFMRIFKGIFKNIFSISDADYSHKLIRVLGLRIRILKSSGRQDYKKIYKKYKDITKVPKADGFLREYQLALFSMLKEMDRICTSHKIRYMLSGGTLLGARRHKGFVPWDDDIDTDMIREDYEKFPAIFNACTTNSDLYCDYWRDKNAPATCYLKIQHRKLPQVCVDIFPLDFYYTRVSDKDKKRLNKKIKFIRKMVSFSPKRIESNEELLKKFAHIKNDIINEKIEVDERLKPSIYFGMDFPQRRKNWIYDYEHILPLKKIEFEGHKFNCPNNVEYVLKNVYGNYMNFPKTFCPHHTDSEAFTKRQLTELKKLTRMANNE